MLFIYPFLSLLFVLTLMPLFIKLARRYDLYDQPDFERKIHSQKIPYTGGLCFVSVFTIVVTTMWYIDGLKLLPSQPATLVPMYLYISEAAFIIFMLGAIDDFRELSFARKFLFQFLAAMFIILGATKSNMFPKVFSTMESSVLINSIGTTLTLLWIVGSTNAINMIDGMDGLAGGTSLLSSLALGVLALLWSNVILALVMFILAGSLLGFLTFNRNPARVFMGDTGSMFLGFLLAVCGWMMIDSAPTRVINFTIPVIILGFPVADTLLAFVRRLIKGKNPFSADTFHIHHMLQLRFNLSTKRTVYWLHAVSFVFSASGVAIALLPQEIGWILIGILIIGLIVFLHTLGYSHLLFPRLIESKIKPELLLKRNGIHKNANGLSHQTAGSPPRKIEF